MLSGLYRAGAALAANQQESERIARNVAHIPVAGYQAEQGSFAALLGPDGQIDMVRAQPSLALQALPTTYTGRPLDAALQESGLFVVQGSDGELVLTADGSFDLNADGVLIHQASGFPVLGDNGPLIVPDGATGASLTPEGALIAEVDGVPTEIGHLAVADIPFGASLERAEGGYRLPGGAEPPLRFGAPLQVAARVRSGADLSEQLVSLIETQRRFAMNARMASVADQAAETILNIRG